MQTRAWRSERADERRERIYAPLYDELGKVEEALTNYNRTNTDIWGEYNRIKREHITWKIPRDLRKKISRLFEVEVNEFAKQLMVLEDKWRHIINVELTQGLAPIGETPDATVLATSDSSIATLKELSIYLSRGTLPKGAPSIDFENAFQAVKARSSNLPYNNVKELFNRYLQEYRSEREYQKLNEQRKLSLRSVKDIMETMAKDLETQN